MLSDHINLDTQGKGVSDSKSFCESMFLIWH